MHENIYTKKLLIVYMKLKINWASAFIWYSYLVALVNMAPGLLLLSKIVTPPSGHRVQI